MGSEIEVKKESVQRAILDAFHLLNKNKTMIFAGQTVNTSNVDYILSQIKNPFITEVEGKCTIGSSVNFAGGGEFVFEKENEGQLTLNDYSFNGVCTIKMKGDKLIVTIKDNVIHIKSNLS